MNTEKRLAVLEDKVDALINTLNLQFDFNDADISSVRQTDDNQNTDIADNRAGIEETFESSLTNADDIADVRTALEEVYELIANEEE